MALFYLIRHGEPTYDHMLENGFWGFGRDFAPLTEKGKLQAEAAAKDIRLKGAEIIVSSPYTRALQTAQIISRETGIRVEVELDLHEWIPDQNNLYQSSEESFALAREFTRYRGEYPPRYTAQMGNAQPSERAGKTGGRQVCRLRKGYSGRSRNGISLHYLY